MAEPPPAEPTAGRADEPTQLDDRPPFLSWRGIYLLVLGAMAVQVVLYAVLARVMR